MPRSFVICLFTIIGMNILHSCCIDTDDYEFSKTKTRVIDIVASESALEAGARVIPTDPIFPWHHHHSPPKAGLEFVACFKLKNFSGCLALVKRELMEEIHSRIDYPSETGSQDMSSNSSEIYCKGRLVNVIGTISLKELGISGPKWFEGHDSFHNRLDTVLIKKLLELSKV